MTTKTSNGPTLAELREHSNEVAGVLVDNGRTNCVVYGLILSLQDEYDRGRKRETLKKEFTEAIALVKEQFPILFPDELPENDD